MVILEAVINFGAVELHSILLRRVSNVNSALIEFKREKETPLRVACVASGFPKLLASRHFHLPQFCWDV